RELPLETTGEYLSFSATRVAAQVRIEEIPLTRELKRVPVELRHASNSGLRIVPESVKLTVRGPKHLVADLELGPGAVYIDADEDHGAGTRMLKPTVELPAGVELFSVDPPELKLLLPAPKRPARGRG